MKAEPLHTSPRDEGPLDALLAAAVDAIVISDGNGTVLRFNSAAQQMFGHTEDAMLGRNVRYLMPEPFRSQHDGYLRRYRETGRASIIGRGREITGLRANGNVFPLHLSVGEINSQGRARYVAIIRDLSQEKATEDKVRELTAHLAHADRLVMLGELTAGIAHEINQPLTAIAAYADAGGRMLTCATPEMESNLGEICQRVAEQARRAGDVVTRLRKLSYKGELTRGSHDLPTLLANVLLLFEHELKQSNVELETVCEPGLPALSLDEIQVQQVLVNLIKNSLDALRSAQTESPRILVKVGRSDEHVDIRVTDNGPGVPEAMEKRLFEPFFTTKQSGVGLGLSICRNIAIAHGGNLAYRRREQGGAEFRLSLPLELIG
jgi:two-component system sensor kinase FixL